MKVKILFFVVFFFVSVNTIYGQAPRWEWGRNADGGAADTQEGIGIATDSQGNVYAIGIFHSATFQNDSIIFGNITLYASDSSRMFIVKYDSNGNLIWIRSPRDFGDGAAPSAITVDAGDNIYVTGSYGGDSISFGNSMLYSRGGMFIVKYDADGNVVWLSGSKKNYFSISGTIGSSIAVDSNKNVFVAGDFDRADSIVFGNDTLAGVNNFCGGCSDVFLVKFDSTGHPLWANWIGGRDNDNAIGVALDKTGNFYVTGTFFNDTIRIGNITLGYNHGTVVNIFIAKYDGVSGNVIWAKESIGNYGDASSGIVSDAGGNIYVTGYFYSDMVTFGNIALYNTFPLGHDCNIFLTKYDSSGNVIWAKSEGMTNLSVVATTICTDAIGGIYIAGVFYGDSISFSSNKLVNTLPTAASDMFVVKYDSSGAIKWAKGLGGTQYDYCGGITATYDRQYIVGAFQSPFIVCNNDTLRNSNNKWHEFFIAKLGYFLPDNTSGDFNRNSHVSIFPNPAHHTLTIAFNATNAINHVALYDLTGRIILEKTFATVVGEGKIEIDLRGVARGGYVVKVGEERGMVVVE